MVKNKLFKRSKRVSAPNKKPRTIYEVDAPIDFLGLANHKFDPKKTVVVIPPQGLVPLPQVSNLPKFNDFASAYACAEVIIVQGVEFTALPKDKVIKIG